MKRILDLRPKELMTIEAPELLQSLRASEGRTMVSEVVVHAMSMLLDVTNGELVAAMGSDIILLNMYDAEKPAIFGVNPSNGESPLETLKHLTGRVIGVNLEPVDPNAKLSESSIPLPQGRLATVQNAHILYEQGARMLVLTGNPKTGVTNEAIIHTLTSIKQAMGDKLVLVAGKMHSAGVASTSSQFITIPVIDSFIDAGADIILLPSPGTVPGITVDSFKVLADHIHERNCLVLATIGTSQEGSDVNTIRTIALQAKMGGADLHHIGDAGYFGAPLPENIMAYSIVIRGVRHTYRRMSMR